MAKKGKRGKRGAQGGPQGSAPAGDSQERQRGPAAEHAPASAASAASAPHEPSASLAGASDAVARTAASLPRPLANALILAVLAYQVAMPLRYYLGGRGFDERFSWRMFSSLRMQHCSVDVRETVDGDVRRLDLRKEVQVAWIGMLERHRRPVIDKLLARRCERAGASKVRFERRCTDTDGSALPETSVERDCKTSVMRAEEAAP